MNAFSRRTLLAGLAVSLAATSATAASEGQRVEAAAADFYARISVRDIEGVSRYLPPGGFTEFGVGAGDVTVLDRHNFEGWFKQEPAIDLRAVDLKVQEYGDTAIVTGKRVGSLTAKGQPRKESQAAETMVWTKSEGRWLLRHVHLSPIESKAR